MSSIKEILNNRYQGLPGIGINGDIGNTGEKGRSIYIGYLKSFFEYTPLSIPNYIYLREKNKTKNNPSSADFYYRSDENFYSGEGRLITFSLYNLHGVLFNENNIQAIGREGHSYKAIVKSDDFWKRKQIDSEGNPVKIKGYQYIGTNPDWSEEELRRWKRNHLDIDDIFFPIKVGDDYIEQRKKKNSESNYSQNMTDDVVVPTNLKPLFNSDDILYILDDITGEIISYIIITQELVGCSFNKFLEQEFITCEPLKSTFVLKDGRVQINKPFFVSEVNTHAEEFNDNVHFRKNFVKRLDATYPFSVPYNTYKDYSEKPFMELKVDANQGTICSDFTVQHNSQEDELTTKRDQFVFRAPNFKMNNLFIKNIPSNININEYNDSDIKMVGEYKHTYPLMENGFVVLEDNSTVTLKINSNDFFNNDNEISEKGYYYGFEIYKKEENGIYSLLKKLENHSSIDSIEFRFLEEYYEDGDNYFGVVTTVRGNGISTSYSKMSEVEIHCQISASGVRISEYTFRQSTTSTSTSVDDDFNNDFCSFVLSEITCERIDDAILTISSNNGCVIKDVYFGNEKIVEDSSVKKSYNGSWVGFDKKDVNINNTEINFSKIRIDENLQNITLDGSTYYPDSIGECLSLMSKYKYKIGEKMQETEDRNIIVTVITLDEENNNTYRSSFIFNQPGFSNPLNDVSVSFSNIFKNNKLEESNKSDNGVLCNQLQLFTDINVHNFNNETWGKYFDSPRIRINVKLDTETTLQSGQQTYCEETNYNNVHIYSKYDKDRYPNNAVKTDFYWIKGGQGIGINSDVASLKENSHPIEKIVVLKNTSDSDIVDTYKGWVVINNQQLTRESKSVSTEVTIPYDFNYSINDTDGFGYNSIGGEFGLTFDEVNTVNDHTKIRTVCEIANPIPMEFNFRWKVDTIEILGQLKQDYKDTWKKYHSEANVDEDIIFTKLFNTSSVSEVVSENMKYIINPVYMTLCPSEDENQQELKGAVKIVGSDEGILLKTGFCDIDQRTKDEFQEKEYYNTYIRYTRSKIVDNDNTETMSISDITYYYPKKKYLQDNITNISVISKDTRKFVTENLIQKTDIPFLQLNELFLSNADNAKSRLNIYPIDWEESENSEYAQSYIQINFDADYMNPVLRKGENNFWFNDELYLYDNYNQWNSVSPLWVSVNLNNEIVSAETIEAKQIWNYEYEVSSKYKELNVFGGVLTKSGNGYINLFSDSDYGQYENDKIMGLDALKEDSETYILETPVISELNYPQEYVNQPEEDGFFRALLFKADWNFPNFINIENDIKVYPYILTNSFESILDSSVMEDILSCNPNFVSDYIKERCSSTAIFVEGTDSSTYLEKKLKQGVWSTVNGQKATYMSNTSFVNMMIPYNIMFDVYPRTMYNTDAIGNVVNIVMLQQPNVIEDGQYEFDKRYFEIKEEDKSPILPPWNFNA